jgi:tetratricopeptide (TPR) repeat protein
MAQQLESERAEQQHIQNDLAAKEAERQHKLNEISVKVANAKRFNDWYEIYRGWIELGDEDQANQALRMAERIYSQPSEDIVEEYMKKTDYPRILGEGYAGIGNYERSLYWFEKLMELAIIEDENEASSNSRQFSLTCNSVYYYTRTVMGKFEMVEKCQRHLQTAMIKASVAVDYSRLADSWQLLHDEVNVNYCRNMEHKLDTE